MSNVKTSEKTPSDTDFFYRFEQMNDALTDYIIRDFGVKKKSNDLNVFLNNANMNTNESAVFQYLCETYNIQVESNAPLYLIERYRNQALDCLDAIEDNIIQANTIYVQTKKEWDDRRHYQWVAQSKCYRLERIMFKVRDKLPVKYKSAMAYIKMIKKEIQLIKDWRSSDRKRLESIIMEHEAKWNEKLIDFTKKLIIKEAKEKAAQEKNKKSNTV